MRKKLLYRSWFYFRTGWSTYFAFVLAAINTLTVTYYLAIEKIPYLKEIFPTFAAYLLAATAIGIPLLTIIGYAHYKRSSSFKSEADITMESNPHLLRLLKNTETVLPYYIEILELLLRLSKNEKLNDVEIEKISKLKNELKEYISKKTMA